MSRWRDEAPGHDDHDDDDDDEGVHIMPLYNCLLWYLYQCIDFSVILLRMKVCLISSSWTLTHAHHAVVASLFPLFFFYFPFPAWIKIWASVSENNQENLCIVRTCVSSHAGRVHGVSLDAYFHFSLKLHFFLIRQLEPTCPPVLVCDQSSHQK